MTRTLQSSAVTRNSCSGAKSSKLCCRAVRLKTFCVSTCCHFVCQLFFVGKPTKAVSCVDVRVTGPSVKSLESNKQKVKASRWKMEASRRQPACESEPAGGGTQQATASRREQEASRRKSTGGRRMPATTGSQQARERTDKLDRCGSQQATASRREKEASRWKPAGGRWKPAGGCPRRRLTTTTATTTPTTTTMRTATTTADIGCPACSSVR